MSEPLARPVIFQWLAVVRAAGTDQCGIFGQDDGKALQLLCAALLDQLEEMHRSRRLSVSATDEGLLQDVDANAPGRSSQVDGFIELNSFSSVMKAQASRQQCIAAMRKATEGQLDAAMSNAIFDIALQVQKDIAESVQSPESVDKVSCSTLVAFIALAGYIESSEGTFLSSPSDASSVIHDLSRLLTGIRQAWLDSIDSKTVSAASEGNGNEGEANSSLLWMFAGCGIRTFPKEISNKMSETLSLSADPNRHSAVKPFLMQNLILVPCVPLNLSGHLVSGGSDAFRQLPDECRVQCMQYAGVVWIASEASDDLQGGYTNQGNALSQDVGPKSANLSLTAATKFLKSNTLKTLSSETADNLLTDNLVIQILESSFIYLFNCRESIFSFPVAVSCCLCRQVVSCVVSHALVFNGICLTECSSTSVSAVTAGVHAVESCDLKLFLAAQRPSVLLRECQTIALGPYNACFESVSQGLASGQLNPSDYKSSWTESYAFSMFGEEMDSSSVSCHVHPDDYVVKTFDSEDYHALKSLGVPAVYIANSHIAKAEASGIVGRSTGSVRDESASGGPNISQYRQESSYSRSSVSQPASHFGLRLTTQDNMTMRLASMESGASVPQIKSTRRSIAGMVGAVKGQFMVELGALKTVPEVSGGRRARRESVISPSGEVIDVESYVNDSSVNNGERRRRKRALRHMVTLPTEIETNRNEDEAIQLAGVILKDTLDNRHPLMHRLDPESVHLYRIQQSVPFRLLMQWATLLSVLLCLIEEPSTFTWQPPYAFTGSIELVLNAIFVFELFVRSKYTSRKSLMKNVWVQAQVAFLFFTTVEVLVFIGIEANSGNNLYSRRMFRILRVIPVFYFSRDLRSTLSTMTRMVPSVMDVLLLVFFTILLYCVISIIVFTPKPWIQQAASNERWAEGAQQFPFFGEGMWNLYVLLSTANFPDVMMPAYNDHPLWALFFISFLVICLYFLLSLVLATVYDKYREGMLGSIKRVLYQRSVALNLCFRLLTKDCNGKLSRQRFQKLVQSMRWPVTDFGANVMFNVLSDGNDDMSFLQFSNVTSVMHFNIVALHRPPLLERTFPGLYRRKLAQWLCKVVQHPLFDYSIILVVSVNVISSIVFLWYKTRYAPEHRSRQVMWVEIVFNVLFSLLYAIELSLKLFNFGFKRFWSSQTNRADFVIIVVSSAFAIAYYSSIDGVDNCDDDGADVAWIKLTINTLRYFRVAVLINRIQRFRLVIGTLIRIMPAYRVFAMLLFSIYYIYSVVGVFIWGGQYSDTAFSCSFQGGEYRKPWDCPSLLGTNVTSSQITDSSSDLSNSYVSEGGFYYLNNFNNFGRSFVTLFELMVVNNWQVTSAGFVHLAGTVWSRLFFLSFNIICVLLSLNVLQAFVIEAFQIEVDSIQAGQDPVVHRLEVVAKSLLSARYNVDGTFRPFVSVNKASTGRLDILERIFKDEVDFKDIVQETNVASRPSAQVTGQSAMLP